MEIFCRDDGIEELSTGDSRLGPDQFSLKTVLIDGRKVKKRCNVTTMPNTLFTNEMNPL